MVYIQIFWRWFNYWNNVADGGPTVRQPKRVAIAGFPI